MKLEVGKTYTIIIPEQTTHLYISEEHIIFPEQTKILIIQPKPVKTFIIRNKETKAIYLCKSGKSSWKTIGHAKSAWHQSEYYFDHNAYFDDQDVYEIVELKHDSYDTLVKAKELLRECLDERDYQDDLAQRISALLLEE